MRLLLVFLFQFLLCLAKEVTFNVSTYNPQNSVFKQFTNVSGGVNTVRIEEVPRNVGFFVVQVHSYVYNVTLSYSDDWASDSYINGTNVGLVSNQTTDDQVFFLFANNNHTECLIVITIYQDSDPIPGGCNLSLPTLIAPYQLISLTEDLTIVHSQPPNQKGVACERNNVTVEMYHLYLPENNYDQSVYFDGIQQMLTVEAIRKNGRHVNTVDGFFKYRKLYSAYRGVGHVFAIVATFNNKSSAYVPAVSYSCDLENIEGSCNGPVTPHWKLLNAILLLFGLFVCFFGHKFFRTTLYTVGFTVGLFITYIILSSAIELSVAEKATTSILVGLIYAALWLVLWWKFGIPIVSVSATYILGAFLLTSTIFYAGVVDFNVFHDEANFWLTQLALIGAFAITFAMFTCHSHIFVLSLLGSYSAIAALNYYGGGNLQYIFINAYRRIAVKNFNMATIDPPFQTFDICHTLLWAVLLCFGYYYQWREQKGKPPFPPARVIYVEHADETTPLLSDNPVTPRIY